MSSALMAGMTPLDEALEGADVVGLVASDGAGSTLASMQLRAGLQNAGFQVDAKAPEGTKGDFNARVACADTKVVPAAPAQDAMPGLVIQQTLSNG